MCLVIVDKEAAGRGVFPAADAVARAVHPRSAGQSARILSWVLAPGKHARGGEPGGQGPGFFSGAREGLSIGRLRHGHDQRRGWRVAAYRADARMGQGADGRGIGGDEAVEGRGPGRSLSP